ncbi:helix-turn-helix domain-containing protein [Streptomyces sp.]|uniref:helix-turn-helix domain-containing protein n=1 Tax=Streptomyces sp. TaxID=1931 RepID=UPI00281236D1|nr:helix-turn-helix domain-containing protein [Streptomyces sp.]
MTPASARDLRRARVAQLRQAEPHLSHREMAERLGVSKDTVRRDLEALDAEAAQSAPPTKEPLAQVAPQVNEPGAPGRAPDAPAAGLPRRVADPLAGMDVSQWRALRRDLAVLAQTGRSPEALVHQAVLSVAHSYRQALARGDLQPGQPFLISSMQLRPAAQLADRPVPELAERP